MKEENKIILHHGDNIEILRSYPDNYFGSIATDPPYGLGKEPDPFIILGDWVEKGYSEVSGKGFMGKEWDSFVPQPLFWRECFRVLKPGGHMAVFCGTRTQDWMALSIRLAGFEIRDVISWLNGQGFPKSYNIANGIDGKLLNRSSNKKDFKKLDGEESKKGLGFVTTNFEQGNRPNNYNTYGTYKTNINLVTEEAKKWKGWGTALKPACEFITLARKPISEKSVVDNILKWGVGGLNIDATRIELNGEVVPINKLEDWSGFGQIERPDYVHTENTEGRFPSNLILDEEAGKLLDKQSGESSGKYSPPKARTRKRYFETRGEQSKSSNAPDNYGDSGGASRFFYCPKVSKKEAEFGLEDFEPKKTGVDALRDNGRGKTSRNSHPTKKPIALMEYIIKLITPPDEICVDPFMGSGSTIIAGKRLGIKIVGIEKEEEYFEIATKRIEAW